MNTTTRLSDYTAKQIASEFTYKLDAFGESSDRYSGIVTHKTTGAYYRVKIMKTGVVRAVHSTVDCYCDPKLSTGRAKAVLSLFPEFHS